MEKELNCSNYGIEIQHGELNSLFVSNWDTSMDQNDPFESALSSIVSSPTATSNADVRDGTMMRELIGRLGSICDSGEISCIATANHSTDTSSYNTPLNSPPKLNVSNNLMNLAILDQNPSGILQNNYQNHPNLASFNADPGFVERAARFSCFGNVKNLGQFENGELGHNNKPVSKLETGKLSRVLSDKSIGIGGNSQMGVNFGGFEKRLSGISRVSTLERAELGDSREGSSVSEENPGGQLGLRAQIHANSKKRKSTSMAKVKETSSSSLGRDEKVETENEEGNAKRSKVDDEKANKKENAGEFDNEEKQSNNNENKEPKSEPPKDYIHVRARRGQATDSHSLAERVRREKISERMKFLQDLVPGCNKVTGKATVLDEIINYVQSLQCKVEFLSMKLATVNPRMDINMEALLSKDSRGSQALPQNMYPAQASSFGYQSTQQMPPSLSNGIPNGTDNPFSLNPLNAIGIRRNPSIQLPSVDGFGDSVTRQPTFWEDDLQSVVQMGIAQNQTQSVPGAGIMPNSQMKSEL